MSLEIHAASQTRVAIVRPAGRLHEAAAAKLESIAGLRVPEFRRLTRVAQSIDSFGERPLVVREILRLSRPNCRGMPAHPENLRDPLCPIVHALMFQPQPPGFMKDLGEEVRQPLGRRDVVPPQ